MDFFFHFLECQCYLKGTGGSNECDGNNGKCNLVPGCKNNFIGGHCEICIDPIPCYKQESSCYPCRKLLSLFLKIPKPQFNTGGP